MTKVATTIRGTPARSAAPRYWARIGCSAIKRPWVKISIENPTVTAKPPAARDSAEMRPIMIESVTFIASNPT